MCKFKAILSGTENCAYQVAISCLTGEHEKILAQSTNELQNALKYDYDIPSELWPSGLRLATDLLDYAAKEGKAMDALANKRRSFRRWDR